MKVVIMSGIPGSGKTTMQKKLYEKATVYSSDDFFRAPCAGCKLGAAESCAICKGTGEVYNFPTEPLEKSRLLQKSHGRCLKNYLSLLAHMEGKESEFNTVVIDNTNTTASEVAPYAAAAMAYGHNLLILTVECPIELAVARQVHNVPYDVVMRMAARLRERVLPTYWPQTTISVRV